MLKGEASFEMLLRAEISTITNSSNVSADIHRIFIARSLYICSFRQMIMFADS